MADSLVAIRDDETFPTRIQAAINTLIAAGVIGKAAVDLSNVNPATGRSALGLGTAAQQPASAFATLVGGVIPAVQLPGFVDDVLEFSSAAAFPTPGESGKLYVALDTNKVSRWSGSAYVVVADGVTLGETASTAYRGDRGKAAYDHSQASGNPHGTTAAQVGAQKLMTLTPVKVAAYAVQPFEVVPVDISGGSFTLTLPSTATAWAVTIKVRAASAVPAVGNPTTTCTVACAAGTDTLNGVTGGSVPLRFAGQGKTFTSDGAGNVTITDGDFDKTVLDTLYASIVNPITLPDLEGIAAAATMTVGRTNVLTATTTASYAMPAPTTGNLKQRLAIRNRSGATATVSYVDETGTAQALTLGPRESTTMRQGTTSGWEFEDRVPKSVLDGLYARPIWTPSTWHMAWPGDVSTVGLSAGSQLFWPLVLPSSVPVKTIRTEVTTATSGATLREGIFTADPITGLPDPNGLTDYGTVSASVAEVKDLSRSTAVTQPGGRLLWATVLALGGTVTVRRTIYPSLPGVPLPSGFAPTNSAAIYGLALAGQSDLTITTASIATAIATAASPIRLTLKTDGS